jgi:hypothetical protein
MEVEICAAAVHEVSEKFSTFREVRFSPPPPPPAGSKDAMCPHCALGDVNITSSHPAARGAMAVTEFMRCTMGVACTRTAEKRKQNRIIFSCLARLSFAANVSVSLYGRTDRPDGAVDSRVIADLAR